MKLPLILKYRLYKTSFKSGNEFKEGKSILFTKGAFLPNLSTKTWLTPLVLLCAIVLLWRKKVQFLPNLSTKTWLTPLVLLSALVPLWRKKVPVPA